VSLLGQSDAECTGVDGYLGNEPMVPVFRLHCGAMLGLAVADQLIQTLCPTRDLADHPALEDLTEFLEMGLDEQEGEGGI